MTAITFDTHKFISTLKLSGLPENQAEAISNAFKEAQGEAELATKRDITDLRHEIHDLKRDMHDLEQRLIIRLGGLIAVAIGIVAALVKLL